MSNIHVEETKKKLDAIPLAMRGETRTKLVPWIFTNDHDFAPLVPKIDEAIKAQARTGRPRVAVLSGVGSLLTIAPHVDVDMFVSVDRNSFVLDEIERMVVAMREASDSEDFASMADLSGYFHAMREVGVNTESYWNMERESFGDQHFTASDDNFTASRRALMESPVLYSQGNFTDPYYVEALGKALQGTDIVYASYTDLAEWYPKFLDVVPLLGVADNGVIAWSSNKGQTDARPVAKLSLSPDQYLTEAREGIVDNNVTYFQEHV